MIHPVRTQVLSEIHGHLFHMIIAPWIDILVYMC